jgi:hypothetical protein
MDGRVNHFQTVYYLNLTFLCRLSVIQIVFIVNAVVMALFSILLLVFGFLATGATRQNVYSGKNCIMGGRVSAGFVSLSENLYNSLSMSYIS